MAVLRNGFIKLSRVLPILQILLLSLAIFTMAASIWAWVGDNPGRLLRLALVTLSSLIIIVNNIILMAQGVVVGPDVIKSVGNIIRGLFWIGIKWWYLNRKQTLAYFRQKRREEDVA